MWSARDVCGWSVEGRVCGWSVEGHVCGRGVLRDMRVGVEC